MFDITPPKKNIGSVDSLTTLIYQYPNEELIPQFVELSKHYAFYRPINGDGNCFYRSFAFLYLASVQLHRFNEVFSEVQMVCQNIPIDFNNFRFINALGELWQIYLMPLANQNKHERQKRLEQYFNKSWLFDTILIAYFRCINIDHIRKNKNLFEQFTANGVQEQIEKISKFNEQSQGVQLNSLSHLFQIKLTIMLIDKHIVKPIVYTQKSQRLHFILSFRPGHYEILYQINEAQKKNRNSTVNKQQLRNQQIKYKNSQKLNSYHNKTINNSLYSQKYQQKPFIQLNQKSEHKSIKNSKNFKKNIHLSQAEIIRSENDFFKYIIETLILIIGLIAIIKMFL